MTFHERLQNAMEEWSNHPSADIWDLIMVIGDHGLTMAADEIWDELEAGRARLRIAIEQALDHLDSDAWRDSVDPNEPDQAADILRRALQGEEL